VRHTKIIATVGPACDDELTLGKMIAAGVDVLRLNFAHGSHESHAASLERIRRASTTSGRVVGVMADLGGPKLRTGPLEGGGTVSLRAGDELVLATGDFAGDAHRLSTPYPHLARGVQPGDRLLLDDGRIQLEVLLSDGHEIRTRVIDGGALGERKGISAPGVTLPDGALTPKDVDDLVFGVGKGIDLIGMSFVQSAGDLSEARAIVATHGLASVPLVAKFERPSALTRLDEIVEASDGVMVARGDLGLEMPLEQVPLAQKAIIRRARSQGIPVIVATQVLESMRSELRPTRAEVSDAAHSVELGVDAIMLAGETAVGLHPVRTVETLDVIIREAEKATDESSSIEIKATRGHALALCEAAITLSSRGDAQAIVAITQNGHTAQLLSALRPAVPILAATTEPSTARRLTLYWGVVPVLLRTTKFLETELRSRGLVPSGAQVVLVNVTPKVDRGDANFLRLVHLP
jgi:pyruvate kinase